MNLPSLCRSALLVAMLPLLCLPSRARAQSSTPEHRMVVGVDVAAFQTSHPEGGPLGVGGFAAIEMAASRHVVIRIAASAMTGVSTTDEVSICHRLPDGTCLPDAVFPRSVGRLETIGLYAPMQRSPLRLLGGQGVARPFGARENRRRAASIDSTVRTQVSWRAGVEVSLGHSRRAPRLQLSRTGFSSALLSLKRLDAASLVIPF